MLLTCQMQLSNTHLGPTFNQFEVSSDLFFRFQLICDSSIYFAKYGSLMIQWSLQRKTVSSAVSGWSLVGVQSYIGVQNVHKILFGEDKGRSHKTSQSLIRGSLIPGTTVLLLTFYTKFLD